MRSIDKKKYLGASDGLGQGFSEISPEAFSFSQLIFDFVCFLDCSFIALLNAMVHFSEY